MARLGLIHKALCALIALILICEFTSTKWSGVFQEVTMMASASYESYSYSNRNSSILTIHQTSHLMSDDKSSSSKIQIQLIHVLSPFVVKKNDSIYYPLDRNQFATFASIERAQKRLPKSRVHLDVVCAVLEDDRQALSHLPCRQVVLERSTRTEYPSLVPRKTLPFLQDIYNASTTKFLEEEVLASDFYWMLTNADIGLTKNFYVHLYKTLQRHDAFSINRLTLPNKNVTDTTNQRDLLSQVDSVLSNGTRHPGYDCFVIHSSVLKRVNFGNMFLGHPPWGANLHLSLKIMANNYSNFGSNVNGTFHLGDDKSSWAKQQRITTRREDATETIKYCPVKNPPTDNFSYQNILNCGQWFRFNRIYGDRTIPAFVQPGYEELYLERQPRFFANSTQGYPIPLKNWNATTNTTTIRSRENMIRQKLSARGRLVQRRGNGRLAGKMQNRTSLTRSSGVAKSNPPAEKEGSGVPRTAPNKEVASVGVNDTTSGTHVNRRL
jgi:hypothetical protein